MVIKVVCSWCGKIWFKKGELALDGISHGMCETCFRKMRATFPIKVSTEK